jgi:glycosyltransferase involved in cell wall biosynthesis
MKVLVYAHRLEIGGTQTNAFELAAALRDRHGFEVTLFAAPGPMHQLVREKGLRYIPAPDAYVHPSPARMCALRNVVRLEQPDLIQVWDWWQCLDAYYGVYLPMRVPLLVSDMMMDLTRILPKRVPTTFGVPAIVDRAMAAGRDIVELVLPPVDVTLNAPGAVDGCAFRQKYGVETGEILIVSVSRLAHWMKSESLQRAIASVDTLVDELPLRLLIAGDGMARGKLQALADNVNSRKGRPVVNLTGALMDPRIAYAAADIVIGMGGSALRGMAFSKAVIIAGERGFSAPFTPESSKKFYYEGIYGVGDGDPAKCRLTQDIRLLASHPEQLPSLGDFARQFVQSHFSLETVSDRLAAFCYCAVKVDPPLRAKIADAARTAAVYLRERRYLTPSRDPGRRNEVLGTQGT